MNINDLAWLTTGQSDAEPEYFGEYGECGNEFNEDEE